MKLESKQKRILVVILETVLLLILLMGLVFRSISDKPAEDDLFNEELMQDPGIDLVLPTDDEFYGDYGKDLTLEEKDYIYLFKETYKRDGFKELAESFAEYKAPSDLYLSDAYGNQLAPVKENKPFMIYFANVFKDEDNKWAVDTVSNNMELLKAGASQDDPNLYIIPSTDEIKFEDFHKLLPESDYIYSMDRTLTELYDIKGDNPNVCMFFNADGTPAFVSINSNVVKFQEYLPLVFNHQKDLPMADIMSEISEIMDNK